jgi:hypothetical protein
LGGDHCGTTLSCRTFDTPQTRCQWIHNLEHGHAVLLYNCPSGCAPEVQLLVDAKVASNQRSRIIIAPDSALPSKFAAIVWGWGWTGDVLDLDAVRGVLAKQDRDAPERGASCSP